MKKNTKKKVFTLMLVIMLLSIAIVGGSLAWFTAEDSATNTFTVGSIEIKQHEQQHNETGGLENFTQHQTLMPIVNTGNPAADPNYVEKIVTIENTGKNPAYVRTFIAVDERIAPYLYLDLNVAEGWQRDTDRSVNIDGQPHKVLVFTYTNALETRGDTTPKLLKGVYLGAEVDVQMNPTTQQKEFCHREEDGTFKFSEFKVTGDPDNVKVWVATQAVQQEGFNDAYAALDQAFGNALPDFNAQ